MKSNPRRFLLALGVALALVPAAGAQVPDLSGTWNLEMIEKSPTGEKNAELTFEVTDHELVATIKGSSGEVLCRGFFDGPAIRFYYVRPTKKEDFVAKFSGHVHGDLMGGEVDMGKRGTTVWLATRGAQNGVDLSGTWTLQMKNGEPAEFHLLNMTFTQDEAELNVHLTGPDMDVKCDGFVEGRTIRFYYVKSGEDGFVAKFTGKLAGAFMGGEVDMGDKGKTTWRATRNI